MRKELIENNPLLKLSIEFSLGIVTYCDMLMANKKFAIANQLLRSGTAIGANAMEAQNPESRADFIHKIKIAAKEAEETQYWLLLCENATDYPKNGELAQQLEVLQKILGSIIASAKKKSSLSK
jgi:four helix bundle protein